MRIDFSQVNRALVERGFANTRNKKGIPIYSGHLHVASKNENIPATIIFLDREMKKPPIIRLDSRPDWIPAVCPHISYNGFLCYIDSQKAYLPRWNFHGAIISCIHAAEALLNKIANEEVEKDIQDEFLVYWAGKCLLIDLPEDSGNNEFKSLGFFDIKTNNGGAIQLIGASPDYLSLGYKKFIDAKNIHSTSLYAVDIGSPLGSFGENWPPRTVYDVLAWSREISPSIQGAVKKALADIETGTLPQSLVLIQGTNSSCAFAIKRNDDFFRYRKYRRGSDFAHAIINNRSLQREFEIIRFEPTPVDPKSWLARNNKDSHLGLAEKRVVLLGCGSVGGYLAEILCKMGAGQLGGELILSDSDSLLPGNLGRHILGFDQIGSNKSRAICEKLESMYPYVNVRDSNDHEIKSSSTDLVIDATGSKEISHYINELKVYGDISADIIFTWVAGEGVGAQAMIVSSESHACLNCVETDRPGSNHSVLRNGYQTEFKEGSGGCGDWLVPFDVTAAIHAASLAGKMALDWSRGSTHPNLRNVLLDNKKGKIVKDASPKPNKQCPICAK